MTVLRVFLLLFTLTKQNITAMCFWNECQTKTEVYLTIVLVLYTQSTTIKYNMYRQTLREKKALH